jgi:hypothetical protein
MSALRFLAVGDRVAHREDHSWKDGDGIVVRVDSDLAWVEWPDFQPGDVQGPYNREELVAMDDPDIDAEGEAG